MRVSIIDYGMGNLRSVQKAFEKTGTRADIITTARDVDNARAVVLPGVGAFKKCFENLDRLGLINSIVQAIGSGKPFLGICLGLQILFSESEEFGICPGLDIIKGRVVRFPAEQRTAGGTLLKIPHMGWNSLHAQKAPPHLAGIADGAYFYFVHSYYVAPVDPSLIATTTGYGIEFVSSIWKDNVFACQFHPEKSQAVGLQLLKNFTACAAQA
ncbi:MAG: imidazole glycerol phosphate synthase subunit HisH [Proteobacteria bacterium]|nr:imidazole glycerol phosphate synthase subunit HisH [Pseudomonadota bacterium]